MSPRELNFHPSPKRSLRPGLHSSVWPLESRPKGIAPKGGSEHLNT